MEAGARQKANEEMDQKMARKYTERGREIEGLI
jgi:hypothetical protein